jgi:hypothetical protein
MMGVLDLSSYFEQHCEYVQASSLMNSLARQEGEVEISTRIQYFAKAIASGERAQQAAAAAIAEGRGTATAGGFSLHGTSNLLAASAADSTVFSEYLLELKDILEVAGIYISPFC